MLPEKTPEHGGGGGGGGGGKGREITIGKVGR